MKSVAVIALFVSLLASACTPPPVTPYAMTVTPTATYIAPTITPVVCPSTMVALSVFELLPGGYAGAPVAGAAFSFCPLYVGDCVSFITGATGHAAGRITPGTWELRTAVLPVGWLPMQTTTGDGWPEYVYASPGADSVLAYHAYRVAPTRTPTAVAPTPVSCPSVYVALSVFELTAQSEPGMPVAGALMTFCPVYVGTCVTLTTGETGHATATILPGTYELHTALLPPGWLPMQQTNGAGWPQFVYASPGADSVLVYYALRIPPTRTVTPPSASPTPVTVACPNYIVNCKVTCGANEQADVYKRCGPPFVCCLPMATRTATP